jgi:capsular exopolysaccharide synthesis family protein
MSRIQEILKKAEREGGVHRTRSIAPEGPMLSQGGAVAQAIPLPAALVPPVASAAEEPVVARRSDGSALDGRLVAALAPQSLAAEQYRLLRTRITQAESGRALRTVIITSPSKGDGKSLTAANLALTMAQEFQQRVLLLDADLRRPSIHHLFGISDAPGLSDVLMGGASLDDALVSIADHRLTVLPSGPVPTHPAELLGSSTMRRVLDTLRTRFDRVILDMPPATPLADVSVASALADGVLMIVRAGATPKPAIERALSGLDMRKVLGLVLNDAGKNGSGYYGYSGYGYIGG